MPRSLRARGHDKGKGGTKKAAKHEKAEVKGDKKTKTGLENRRFKATTVHDVDHGPAGHAGREGLEQEARPDPAGRTVTRGHCSTTATRS